MNPVLHKEILGLLRLKRIAAVQILFVAVLAALLLAAWPQNGLLTLSAHGQDDLLAGIMLGQLVVLILAVPGVAAASLTAEREANTLEMLYASRLSAWQILSGKLMSVISFPGLLIISGLPFLGLLSFRGALDAGAMLWAYLILIVTAVLLAVISLTVSSLCRATGTALVVAYLVVLGVCGGVLVPAAILLDSLGGTAAAVVHDLRALSPVAAMLSLLRPQMAGDFNGAIKGNYPSHEIFLIAAALAIVICLVILAMQLRHPPAESEPASDKPRARQRKPMSSRNPMLAKETRTSSLRGGSWLIRIFYGMLVLSLMLSLMSLYGGMEYADLLRYVFQVLVAFQLIGIAAVIPSLTAPAISAEIETGTFEMLRLTPLKGRQIFWGKFLPAYAAALLPIAAMLPAYGTICFVNAAYVQYTLAVLPVVLLAMTFCCVLGLACSAFTRNSARATVIAYILVTALFVLPAIAWWAGDAGLIDNQRLLGWLSLPSPLVMGLSVVPASVAAHAQAGSGAASVGFILVPHEYLIGGLCIALLLLSRLRLANLLRRG
jgi:ABC-type transport system involved in multi-copper enzyme maturation permease subunit